MEDEKGVKRRTRDVLSSIDSESSISSPKSKQPKMNNQEVSEVTTEVLYNILMEMKQSLNTLLSDNTTLKKDLEEVKVSLSMQSTIVDGLKKENADLKSQVTELRRSLKDCDAELKVTIEKTEELESKKMKGYFADRDMLPGESLVQRPFEIMDMSELKRVNSKINGHN